MTTVHVEAFREFGPPQSEKIRSFRQDLRSRMVSVALGQKMDLNGQQTLPHEGRSTRMQ